MTKNTPEEALLMVLRRMTPAGKDRGGTSAVARVLGIKPQAVHQWQVVPLQHVPRLAQILGIDESEIRPDHYRPRRGT